MTVGSELASETTAPAAGAGPLKYTELEVDDFPPGMEVGAMYSASATGGFSVRVPLFDDPPDATVIVYDVGVVTMGVVIANVVYVAPAGTVTVGGTDTLGSEDEIDTTAPPAGAEPFRYTLLFVLAVPPVTVGRASDEGVGGVIVRTAVFVTPPAVAEIVTEVFAATAAASIVK
jgi:hypothetical protein